MIDQELIDFGILVILFCVIVWQFYWGILLAKKNPSKRDDIIISLGILSNIIGGVVHFAMN